MPLRFALPQTPQSRPSPGAQIDWEHPLARDLFGRWLLNEGAGGLTNDLVSSNSAFLQGNCSWQGQPIGGAVLFPNGAGDYLSLASSLSRMPLTGWTISWSGNLIEASSYRAVVGGASAHGINHNAGSGIILIHDSGTNNPAFSVSSARQLGRHSWALTSDGATWILYRDGVVEGTLANVFGITWSLITRIGYSDLGTYHGWLSDVSLYRRALSAAEVALLYREPYAMIWQPGARMAFWPSAATTPIAATETAGGTESASIALSIGESAVGADAGTLAAAITAAETASGLDAATIAAALTGTETGSGADAATIAIAITAAESASGLDLAQISVGLLAAEQVSGLDLATIIAQITGLETASGVDAASVQQITGVGVPPFCATLAHVPHWSAALTRSQRFTTALAGRRDSAWSSRALRVDSGVLMAALTIFRDADESFTGQANAAAGGAQDLTGVKLWFTAKWRYDDLDSAAVFQKSSPAGGITIPAGVLGTFTVAIAPADTASLPERPVTLFYDVQALDGAGKRYVVDSGTILVSPHATRAVS